MISSATMLESGINAVAAALIFRKVASMGIEAKIKITGSGMNHRITIRALGKTWRINNARDWFAAEREICRHGL